MQHGGDFSYAFNTNQDKILKLEYPPKLLFNEYGDFPIQDLFHDLKKAINNLKYLDTRFMIMADSKTI